MRLLETRDSLRLDAPRTPGVRRVAVLGDAVVFGRGVTPTDTLPFHLQRHLNSLRTGSVFETINLGSSGDSLWNSWTSFADQPSKVDFALLVLSPVSIRLFGRTVPAIQSDANRSWQPGHPAHAGLLACLDAIAAHAAGTGIKAAVAYLTNVPGSDAAQRAMLAAECQARSLPFFDPSATLAGAGLAAADLAVSAIDAGPGPKVFDAAARSIAAQWQDTGALDGEPALPLDTICETILAAADRTALLRSGPLLAIEWAIQALAAQESTVKRTATPGAAAAFGDRAAEARAQLGLRMGRWHRHARMGAELDQCDKGPDYLGNRVWKFDEAMLLIDEAVFTAPTSAPFGFPPPAETGKSDGEFLRGLMDPAGLLDCRSRLAAPLDQLRRNRAALADDLERTAPQSVPLADFRMQLERLDQRIAEVELRFATIGRKLDTVLGLARSLLAVKGQSLRFELLGFALREAIGAYLETTQRLAEATAVSLQRDFYNLVEVTVDTHKRDMVMQLGLFVDYIWPRRRAMRDMQPFAVNGLQQICRFKVPYFRTAELTLEISGFSATKWFETQAADGPRGAVNTVSIINSAGTMRLSATAMARKEKGRLLFPPVTL